MKNENMGYLLRQFETAWKLTSYHLDGLTTEECLWRPAQVGLHVYQESDGKWLADWPKREGYDLGPSSIAWLTWHLGFWWSMLLNHSFGDGSLVRESVVWPGNAGDLRRWITQLKQEWQTQLEKMTDADIRSAERTIWPFQHRPFGDVIGWANIELTKNAAEIGYVRFLYAVNVK